MFNRAKSLINDLDPKRLLIARDDKNNAIKAVHVLWQLKTNGLQKYMGLGIIWALKVCEGEQKNKKGVSTITSV